MGYHWLDTPARQRTSLSAHLGGRDDGRIVYRFLGVQVGLVVCRALLAAALSGCGQVTLMCVTWTTAGSASSAARVT